MDIRDVDDEELLAELDKRGMEYLTIKQFSDTELNNELSWRRQIHEKQYEAMMAQGLV